MSLFWTTVPRHFNTGPALPSCWWEENSEPGCWHYQLNMFLTGGTWASSRKLMLTWNCGKRSTMIWVKTPGDAKAVVVGPSSTTCTRSYNVWTERGIRRRGHQATMGYPSKHPRPYRARLHSRCQQWEISVTTSLMFSQMSSPRWQVMDVLNKQTVYTCSGRRVKIPKRLHL